MRPRCVVAALLLLASVGVAPTPTPWRAVQMAA
jgi:hypothetical protein